MAATVIINNLTVVHRSSGGTAVAAIDVCKTPTPGGPLPVPYVNTALSRHIAKGTKNVRIDGQTAMLKSSILSRSMGDEPGTLGGVVSGKSCGKASPRSYSLDVRFEGQPVVRFTDMVVQNAGAAPNTAGIISQPNGVAAALNIVQTELLDMRWSKQQLVCGDLVTLSVRTRNADPGQPVQVLVKRTDSRSPLTMESMEVEMQGDRAEHQWISRWCGDFAEKIPANATQRTLQGASRSSNSLEFQTPPPKARDKVDHPDASTPQYIEDQVTKKWVRNGKFYGWPVAFDLEIYNGWMIVTRELDFVPRSGQAPVDPLTWREWADQIERVWDRKFALHRVDCKRGPKCNCRPAGCCKYPLRIFARQGKKHGAIDLWVGKPKAKDRGKLDLWWYSHTWWTEFGDAGPNVRAHEFGHLIGCYDEYLGGACHPAGKFLDVPDSVMNLGTTVYPRHVDLFRRMFEAVTPIVGKVELVRILE